MDNHPRTDTWTRSSKSMDPGGRALKSGNRQDLYREARDHAIRTGEYPFAFKTFGLLLANSQAQIYVVQRGDKDENTWLYDKTAAGHVRKGESVEEAVVREVAEEIGINELVIADSKQYPAFVNEASRQKAVIKRVMEHDWYGSMRKLRQPIGHRHYIRSRLNFTLYVGKFEGKLKLRDGEAIGYQLLTKQKVLELCHQKPPVTTRDLESLVKFYGDMFEDDRGRYELALSPLASVG